MIVDDSQLAIRKMEVIVTELGHTVLITASTGNDALACYRMHTPDLVTMDISMPVMDGIEATRCIMEEYPDARIIIVTSYGQEDSVRQSIKAGASGYVLKPVIPERMAELIDQLFFGGL
jgi:two-component system chemotaxis response regulator CheY